MSNTTDKLAIANIGLLSVGQTPLTSLSPTTPNANKIVLVLEDIIAELLADDWCFNRKRVSLTDLTAVNLLTVVAAPAPAVWTVGAVLTGAVSGNTCTVLEVLSDTTYLITAPSGTLTAAESLSTDTDAAVLSSVEESLAHGSYDYGYVIPTDLLYNRGVSDTDSDNVVYPSTVEGKIVFTNQTEGFLCYNRWVGEAGSATVSDVTLMRRWFHRLISARIAHILSPNITQQTSRESKAQAEYREAYLNAKEQNGNELYNKYAAGSPSWAEAAGRELDNLSI